MIRFEPVFFDSMGAKSSATLVETPDVKILIDPGAAEMQSSFPAPKPLKRFWKEQAIERIMRTLENTEIVVISHYHHDHYLWRDEDIGLFAGKKLFVKNPNKYINESQRKRAQQFFENLGKFLGVNIWNDGASKNKYLDPLEELPHARFKDFGDYQRRRETILNKGLEWFKNLTGKWRRFRPIRELNSGDTYVVFPERKEFKFGKTILRFTKPLFHGVEFSGTGWVFATVVEHGGDKLIHTSDLNGPVIEDYADWIIDEQPDFLIVDGPMTYMLGYLVSNITLRRAVENMVWILENTRPRVVIYDHHLLREPRFRLRTAPVWEVASKKGLF